MQTRRHFLRSAGTSLAGSLLAISFPFMGRASAKSEKLNYIYIDLDISGIPTSRFAEDLQDKIPDAEMLKSAGYDVAYIEREHFFREPFYPESHCAALNLANVEKTGFADNFFSSYNFNWKKNKGHKNQTHFDAEMYISANRDNPFCLFWKHTAAHSTLSPMLAEDKNHLHKPESRNTIADIKASANHAVRSVMKKLEELGIAHKTAVVFTARWQT